MGYILVCYAYNYYEKHNVHTTYCRNKISGMIFQIQTDKKKLKVKHIERHAHIIVTLIDCSLVP